MAYADFYEDAGGDSTIGELEVRSRNYLADPKVLETVKELAYRLQQESDSSPFDGIILV